MGTCVRRYLLLLLPVDFFSPPALARWLLPREALPRSLGARLLEEPPLPLEAALPPLLRLEDDDFELRDAIEISLGIVGNARRAPECASPPAHSRGGPASFCRPSLRVDVGQALCGLSVRAAVCSRCPALRSTGCAARAASWRPRPSARDRSTRGRPARTARSQRSGRRRRHSGCTRGRSSFP